MPSPGPRQRPSLLQKAIALLSRRDYSRVELEQRLQQHLRSLARESHGKLADREPVAPASGNSGDLTTVLDRLQAEGKLCDDRFAASFVRQRATRFGNARLRHDLRAKGLAPELVAATLAALPSAELDRAREIWSRRFKNPPPDSTDWARQARFLAQRGFSSETIRTVLRNAPGAHEQDLPVTPLAD